MLTPNRYANARTACLQLPKMRIFKSLWLVLFLGWTVFANATSAKDRIITIEPGDPRISEDITKPHTSRWAMTRIMPGKAPEQRGAWLDRHEIVEIDGRRLHKFQTDVVWTTGRPRRDIIYWDQETMETVSAELENYNNKGGWAYFIYDKNRVSQVFRREPFDETFSESHDLENRVFEPGHGVVFANLLKLQPGAKIRYPYHQRYNDKVKWITIEAVGREEIETLKYGRVETLLLESSSGWKFWTAPEPPYVYRLDIPIADDGTDRWELLEYIIDQPPADRP